MEVINDLLGSLDTGNTDTSTIETVSDIIKTFRSSTEDKIVWYSDETMDFGPMKYRRETIDHLTKQKSARMLANVQKIVEFILTSITSLQKNNFGLDEEAYVFQSLLIKTMTSMKINKAVYDAYARPYIKKIKGLKYKTHELIEWLDENSIAKKKLKYTHTVFIVDDPAICSVCKKVCHLKCNQCKWTLYCSHKCQKTNWSEHKLVCAKRC